MSASLRRAGQAALVQRTTTSPSGREAADPHTGHRSGKTNGLASAGRFSVTTRTMCGMTSPARSTTTVSPSRTSSRSISSTLWRVERARGAGPRVRLEPCLAHPRQHLPVGLEGEGLRVAELVDVDVEGPAPGDPGVLLPDGPGRGVPGVGEGRLARRLQLAVQALE